MIDPAWHRPVCLCVCVFQCTMPITDVSAATMYDVLHDSKYRKEWDPAMLESFDIARLSANADVGYYSCELQTSFICFIYLFIYFFKSVL